MYINILSLFADYLFNQEKKGYLTPQKSTGPAHIHSVCKSKCINQPSKFSLNVKTSETKIPQTLQPNDNKIYTSKS